MLLRVLRVVVLRVALLVSPLLVLPKFSLGLPLFLQVFVLLEGCMITTTWVLASHHISVDSVVI
jgi:hypothetical protein